MRGVNGFADQRIWLRNLLGFRIFYGLADFEGLADHGLLQYFSVDYGFCLFLSTDGGTDAFPVQKKGQSVPLRTLAQAVEKVGHSQCKVVLLSLSFQCVT